MADMSIAVYIFATRPIGLAAALSQAQTITIGSLICKYRILNLLEFKQLSNKRSSIQGPNSLTCGQ